MSKRVLALVVSALVAMSTGIVSAGASGATGAPAAAAGRRQPYDKILKVAIRDIQDYWSEEFPKIFGAEYQVIPNSRIVAYDERTTDFGACSDSSDTYEDNANNAFYCILDDYVRYDNGTLFPDLYESYGNDAFPIAVVLAHEWGHAIQARFLTEDEFVSAPTILKEQQADCFAGAWVAYVNDGKSRFGLELDPGDLDDGISAMLDVRDQVGSAATDEGAHGSGFDRVGAFQQGFEGGASACSDLLTNPRPIVQLPFLSATDALSGGDAPYDDELFDFVRQDLDLYWSQFTELQPYDSVDDIIEYDASRKRSLPRCDALGLRPSHPKDYDDTVFYCGADDDYIAFDGDIMQNVYDSFGDFGVATLIADSWAGHVQQALDLRGKAKVVGLQADCFTGAWAGSVPIDEPPTTSARGLPVDRENAMAMSPGDLDETVQTFLAFGDTADATEAARGTGFERIQAFRLGFFSTTPEADCLTITGN